MARPALTLGFPCTCDISVTWEGQWWIAIEEKGKQTFMTWENKL